MSAPQRAPDVRAAAAQALAAVALGGASLRQTAEQYAPRLSDPRDRALLWALLNQGARWWLRFDAALERLLDKPLRRRQPAIHALAVLGLVQLEVLGMPSYAAVAATVEAARSLRQPRLAGLLNAVLRRWQREREQHLAALHTDPVARHAHPAWMIETIRRDWPAQAEAILAANNTEPPLTLRVQRRRGSRETLLASLAEAGIEAKAHAWLEDAVTLARSTEVTRLPGFAAGRFAVQDGAAQAAADLLDARQGMRVLDACAAPGGKACHLLDRADVKLTALEWEPARLPRITQNLARLGLKAQVLQGDAGAPSAWWDGAPFQRILLDAPCSATGVMRRRADVRLHRRASDIPTLVEQQRRILAGLWPKLAPGGRLLYATCSLLREENQRVVAAFLQDHHNAHALALRLPAGHAAGRGWQLLPGEQGLDGMYYALLGKNA